MTTTHRISVGAVLTLALVASAAPASARFELNGNGSYNATPTASTQTASPARSPVQGRERLLGDNPTPPSAALSTAPTIVRVTAHNSGFDWGDAGIGAAGGLALSMIGLGGALALSQRRTRRTSPTTAASS